MSDREASEGSATVAMLAGIVFVVAATAVALALGLGLDVRHRAQGAADAAALAAAADSLAGSAGACERAREIAAANGARLRSCSVVDAIADLTVSIELPGVLRAIGPVMARARAGPASVGGAIQAAFRLGFDTGGNALVLPGLGRNLSVVRFVRPT
ncbi:MAG TPA: Rv3654c family TadE-like protein [Mycobacteriales bacterium]|nr:Rv3654c family TadE-like protein [Mycobacteriales bacterium]